MPRTVERVSLGFRHNDGDISRGGECRKESILKSPDGALTHIFVDRANKPTSFPSSTYVPLDVLTVCSRLMGDEAIKAAINNGGLDQGQLEGRVNKMLADLETENAAKRKEECFFCYPKVLESTPEPRIQYDHLQIPDFGPVITFPNLFPFAEDHLVTVFSDHIVNLQQLKPNDMFNLFESIYQLAKKYSNENHQGMVAFMNWGFQAAASQEHPHIQTSGLSGSQMPYTGMGREFETCTRLRKEYSHNPYEVFMDIMRESPCFVFENNDILVYAPYAPRHPDEVDILFKDVSNMLELKTEEKRRTAFQSVLGVFHALYEKRGVTSMNVVLHQSPFGIRYKDTCYVMHLHVIPRNKNNHGGSEKGRCFNVVDTFPEHTAAALREHYGTNGHH